MDSLPLRFAPAGNDRSDPSHHLHASLLRLFRRLDMDGPFGDYAIYEHCLPFNVSRAYDEASGIDHPRIWTDKRVVGMWKALEKK